MPTAPNAPRAGASGVMPREHTDAAAQTRPRATYTAPASGALTPTSDEAQALAHAAPALAPSPWVDAFSASLAATGAHAAAYDRAASRCEPPGSCRVCDDLRAGDRALTRFAAGATASDGWPHGESFVPIRDGRTCGGGR